MIYRLKDTVLHSGLNWSFIFLNDNEWKTFVQKLSV